MKQRDYYVKISFGGSRGYCVTAPDYEEAEEIAQELMADEFKDAMEDVEIYEVSSELDE